MRRALLGSMVAAAVLAVTPGALANGRYPQSNQIVFAPSSPGEIVVRNSFGIAVTKDGGGSWSWLCEDTLGLPPTSNEDPFLGLTSNGSLVAGLSLGLQVSADDGCNWTVEGGPLKGQLVRDLVVHAENPHVVDTITNTFGATAADGGPGYLHPLFETTDDGATWKEFGTPVDPSADVTTIEVAPSDPNRIYVSAFRGDGASRTASLFVSTDHGTTWTEHPAPIDPSRETAAYIGGVDPSDEDMVYLRTEGACTQGPCLDRPEIGGPSRLLVTRDGGKTFQALQRLTSGMLGFALSHDGSEVYVGSFLDGLFVGDRTTLTFASRNPNVHVQCLATRGSELWACSDEPSCFVAGVSLDDGRTFAAKMHLLSIQGPLQCAPGSGASVCQGPPFVALCSDVGACYAPDSGPQQPLASTCTCSGACASAYDPSTKCPVVGNDAAIPCPASGDGGAGGDAGGSSPDGGTGKRTAPSGCGCGIGASSSLGFLAAGTIAAIALGRRRSRGRRSGETRRDTPRTPSC